MKWKYVVWVLEALIVLAILAMCAGLGAPGSRGLDTSAKSADYSTTVYIELRPAWAHAPYGLDETRIGEMVIRPGELVVGSRYAPVSIRATPYSTTGADIWGERKEGRKEGSMNELPSAEALKPVVVELLKSFHRGKERRAEKWKLVELACAVKIPEQERTNNNMYERRVREAVEMLRNEGALICSDSGGGYWWAQSIEDVLAVSDGLRRRARSLLRTARSLRRNGLHEFGGQMRMRL